ncbi:putative AC9 transposase [Fusarium oxysporum f. sp. albedinis]|nr:putative AC9 transposase [Fusarium oxysporum f. sp. albedinis]
MVPCILRPGLLHFILPFTGHHKHQTDQEYKKRSDLTLLHEELRKLCYTVVNMPAQRPSQLPPCPGPPPSRPLPPLPK